MRTLVSSTDNPKILIAGEDKTACGVLKSALESRGYSVHVASSERELTELVGERFYDAVLLSLGMSSLSRLVSLLSVNSGTTILFYESGDSDSQGESMPFGLFVEPVDLAEVAHRLEERLDGRTGVRGLNSILQGVRTDERKIERIARFLQEAVWIAKWDSLEIEYINPSFERIYGVNSKNVIEHKRRWLDFIHPDDKATARKYLESVRRRLTFHPIELRIITQDGRTRWIRTKVFAFLNEDEKLNSFIGLDIDITDQKNLQFAIRENEALFKSIFEKSPIAINIFNTDGTLIAVNEASISQLGVENSRDLRDINLFDFYKVDRSQLLSDSDVFIESTLDFDDLRRNRTIPTHRKGQAYLELAISRLGPDDPEGFIVQVSDVTDKKLANRRIAEEQDKAKLYLDSARAIIVATDTSGRVTLINEYGSELLGISDSRSDKYVSFLDFVPNEHKNLAHEHFIASLMNTDMNSIAEIPLLMPDGTQRVFRWKSTVLHEYGENPVGLISYGEDITELKNAIQNLEESEKLLNRVFERSPIGIAIVNPQGTILRMNSSLLNILGISRPDEVVGKSLSDDPNLSTFVRDILRDDRPFQTDVRYDFSRTIDKGIFRTSRRGIAYLRLITAPLKTDGNGPAKDIVMILQDITESKESEQRTQYLVKILENISEAVISTDRKLKILSWNRTAENIYGYEESEVIGKLLFDVIPTEYNEPDDEDSIKQVFLDGKWTGEAYQLTRLGERLLVRLSISTLRDKNDMIEGLIFVIQDITEEKETKRKLKAEKDRAMLYLDIMGHDIRNKLQAMMMGYDIISRLVDKDEIVEELIEQIQQSAEACTELISKVKRTERLTSVPLEIHDLNSVVQRSVSLFSARNPAIDIQLESSVKQANIVADEFIDDLVLTFLENAIHHNDRERKRIWVSLDYTNGKYLLTIADNGPGISDERKKWLFDKERRFGGLGLHQAKQIADKYGASITVKDRVPHEYTSGARFDIVFPRI